jgi:hypothetical protein
MGGSSLLSKAQTRMMIILLRQSKKRKKRMMTILHLVPFFNRRIIMKTMKMAMMKVCGPVSPAREV